ncbi:HAD-IA family hydrolase [Paenibacillus ihuae]|uniref:HAD-IA family hydrolase n=1 Tax=Paenibacillus ihuae TaxID=1232431 RepID=UPI001FD80F9A|nr:HAD-IA family hydrolase [Paenibacillus ihuae]
MRSYFSSVIGTDQAERGKPFPDMALLACGQLGVHPSAAAVIGDTNGDMRMAKAAGAAVAIGITGAADTTGDAGDNAAESVAALYYLLPDADSVVQSYQELSFSSFSGGLS